VAVLRSWEGCGFERIHIVDLDAATERGSNAHVVDQLLNAATADVQVGGGVRTDERVSALLGNGARYVMLGTRALEEPAWATRVAQAHEGAIIVALDVRGRLVVCHGWQRTLTRDILGAVAQLNDLPLAGVLVSAVHLEGQMRGPDLGLAAQVVAACQAPVFAAGGIASLRDLNALAERGVAGAVIGMALYTGALDPRAVAEEFAA
jgi:phosphoribosylformimino-5-aminoimidazole carboxamide ribotide isomerase